MVSPKALYVHIPFCLSRCPFCSFAVSVNADREEHKKYLDRLRLQLARLKEYTDFSQLLSIYVGGGTPALVHYAILEPLLVDLNSLSPNIIEFTIETNPELLGKRTLDSWFATGVNRISLGIQTTQAHLLKQLGRRNKVADNIRAARLVAEYWPAASSYDFIYAIPEQDTRDIRQDLQFIADYQTQHISWYQLGIEEGTHFYKMQERGRLKSPDTDEIDRQWDSIVNGLLGLGFKHYEISNFSTTTASIHNKQYWQMQAYLGIGLSAVGRIPTRELSPADMDVLGLKLRQVPEPEGSILITGSPSLAAFYRQADFAVRSEYIDKKNSILDFLLMNLRLQTGFKRAYFKLRFNKDFLELLPKSSAKLINDGSLEISKESIRLSKDAWFFLNRILLIFMEELGI